MKAELSQQRLKQLVSYDAETGLFTAIAKRPGLRSNRIGNKRPDGYFRIGIDSHNYLAHRLAWLYVYGSMPKIIDHIDGNPSNNAINNLRAVSQMMNVQNVKKASKRNMSGLLGVSFHARDGLWRARLFANGKAVFCKYFKSKTDAASAYLEAKRKFHPGSTL